MLTVTSEDVCLKHAKRQVRYYKSQLYNAFVISDVCNRSLCVIPFKTEMAKNQEHLGKRSCVTDCIFLSNRRQHSNSLFKERFPGVSCYLPC